MAFEIKANDRRPFFVVVLKDDFGEATESVVDLTAATGVVFNMRQHGGTAVKLNRAAGTISNAAQGECTYKWGTADTNLAGTFDIECEIAWNDGLPETFPGGPSAGSYWSVVITPDLG